MTLKQLLLLLAALPLAVPAVSAQQNRPAAPVVVSTIKSVTDSQRAGYTGTIQPTNKALLSSDAAGRLVKIHKRAGDTVHKDEVLAELRNRTLEQDLMVMKARLGQSQAQLALAEQKQKRIEALFKKKLASAQQYEDGQADLRVARASLHANRVQVARLEDQLNRMTIRSPLDGQIISANGEIGQWITPNQVLFEIYNFEELEMLVGVPGRFLATAPSRGVVKVSIPEARRELTGRIAGVIRHVDPRTGNFHMRILVRNPRNYPLSGMLAKVNLSTEKASTQLSVHRDAVVRRGPSTHVVLVAQGKAKIVPVKVKGNRGDNVIIEGKELAPGAQVVVRGNERLFPGTPVRIAGKMKN